MYKQSNLVLKIMGDIETGSQIFLLSEANDKSSLRRLMLATIVSAGVSLGSQALAESNIQENHRPLQAIPEYSDNQQGWQALYQAQIEGHGDIDSSEYRNWKRKFISLRLSDLGYTSLKDAPKDVFKQVIFDYNDWQSLVWKNKTSEDTDEFLATLASR